MERTAPSTQRPRIESDLQRRIFAAIDSAGVSRALVNEDWPECHKKNCQARHADPDYAFGTMKVQIVRAVRDELDHEKTTRPDVAEPGDSPRQIAVYTLATLLGRYTTGTTGDAWTFVRAAELILDTHPGMIDSFAVEAS